MNDQPIVRLASDTAALATALRQIAPAAAGAGERVLEAARREIEARRRRRRVFGADAALLGDPAWDALLELFVVDARGGALSATSLVLAMHLPTSTGLRWIEQMEARGLLTKVIDAADRRRCMIRPTERARVLVIRSLEPPAERRGRGAG